MAVGLTPMRRHVVTAISIAVAMSCASGALSVGEDGTPLSRTYKVGDKITYTVLHSIKNSTDAPEAVDVDLTVKKLLDGGKAQLGVHFYNQHLASPDDSAKVPDFVFSTGDHNMPADFMPHDRTIDIAIPFLFLANATADKTVKVGDEVPVAWKTHLMGFEDSVKLVDVSPETERWKTLVKVKWTVQGHDAGELTVTSNLDSTDGSLVDAVGEIPMGAFVQVFKFTRKVNSDT